MLIHTTETHHPGFCKPPESLDTINMGATPDEFVLPVIDPEVPAVADIDQAIVSTPAIRVDDTVERDTSPDNALQRGFTAVRDDFCVNRAIAFEDPEDGCFAERPAPSLALDAPGAEVGFVDFDLTGKRRLGLAIFCNSDANASQIAVDCIPVKTSDRRDLSGIQIERKQPDNLPKLMLTDSCTDCVLVFHRHDNRLATFY